MATEEEAGRGPEISRWIEEMQNEVRKQLPSIANMEVSARGLLLACAGDENVIEQLINQDHVPLLVQVLKHFVEQNHKNGQNLALGILIRCIGFSSSVTGRFSMKNGSFPLSTDSSPTRLLIQRSKKRVPIRGRMLTTCSTRLFARARPMGCPS